MAGASLPLIPSLPAGPGGPTGPGTPGAAALTGGCAVGGTLDGGGSSDGATGTTVVRTGGSAERGELTCTLTLGCRGRALPNSARPMIRSRQHSWTMNELTSAGLT